MVNLLTENHIAQLWGKMARVYGHRWVSSFGESDDGTWLEGLIGLTTSNIADGYELMIDSGEYSWPPTLPEFRSLCFGVDKEQARYEAKMQIKNDVGSFDFNKLTTNQVETKTNKLLPSVIRNREKYIAEQNQKEHKAIQEEDSKRDYLQDLSEGKLGG